MFNEPSEWVPKFMTNSVSENDPEQDALSPYEEAVAASLRDYGYAIIDFPEPSFDALSEQIIEDIGPELKGPGRQAVNDSRPVRVQDHPHAAVKKIAANTEVQALLSKLYGKKAFPFQTLTFSVGTQQPVHSDDVHFSSFPKGFMCGVWVALEDIHPDSGPVEVYPGSHHLPNIDGIGLGRHPLHDPLAQPEAFSGHASQIDVQELWDDLLKTADIEPQPFLARKGQALIWVYNLLHGGSKRVNVERTRWSQVTHYYFEGCDYYTPLLSQYRDGHIHYRDDVRDLRTNQEMSGTPKAVLPKGFDPARYLELHPDVKAAGVDAKHHWLHHGFFEKRSFL